MTQRLQGDRGAAAMLIAVMMVGMLAFGGLVMDGSNQYSQRRQMQNAADASATAGANALYRYRSGASSDSSTIRAAALAEALANGARADNFTCDLQRVRAQPDGSPVDIVGGVAPCPTSNSAIAADAWKVRVRLDSQSPTRLIRVVGIKAFTSKGGAAASMLGGGAAQSPFVLCANTANVQVPRPPLLIEDSTDPTGWRINPVAIGWTYNLYGNDIKETDCGLGNDFRGLVDGDTAYAIPGNWDTKNGNKTGPTRSALVDGCASDGDPDNLVVGCKLAVPLCPIKIDSDTLYCVKVGAFRIVTNINHDVDGVLLGSGLVADGNSTGVLKAGDVAVIKLTE
jgi:Flp pilus assembly protein TadG